MEKEFVPYPLALRLKALGFDEPCFATYLKSEFLGYPEVTLCLYSKENIELGNTKNSDRWISLPECCSAPTFSQAFRWFDYSTEWSGFIVPSKEEGCFEWWIQNYEDPNYLTIESDDWYTGREEAELACLDKLIEIVESKSK